MPMTTTFREFSSLAEVASYTESNREEDAAILLSAIRNVEMSEDGPVNFRSVDENMGKLCKKHLTNSLNSQVYTQDIKTTVRCVGCPVWGLNGVGGCRFNNAYTNAILRKEVLKNPVWYEGKTLEGLLLWGVACMAYTAITQRS